MSTTTRTVDVSVDKVWDVLADGWLYPLWVVGASRMREVDATWPEVGARLHHSVGSWPLLLDDTTEVLECDPRSRLVLRARAWPTGSAQVTLTLHPRGPQTEVTIEERVANGPALVVPGFAQDPLLGWRNHEAMRRLSLLVENRP